MASLLHLSFRVKDPTRSAALFAELLDGQVTSSGPLLTGLGVKSVFFGDGNRHTLADSVEFWPQDKHWSWGAMTTADPAMHQHFGHMAFESAKSYEELAAIAEKHGVAIHKEPRGPLGQIPVVYDYEGNYLEFFPPMKVPRPT